MTKPENRIALITGAAGGFGQQLVAQLATAGSRLIVTGRDERLLAGIAGRLATTVAVIAACAVPLAPRAETRVADDPKTAALSMHCRAVRDATLHFIEQAGAEGDVVYAETPPPGDPPAHWISEWRGMNLRFPAVESGWRFGAVKRGGVQYAMVALAEKLQLQLYRQKMHEERPAMETPVMRLGLEPPEGSVFELLDEGFRTDAVARSCDRQSPELSLAADFGLRLKYKLLGSPGDRVWRQPEGILLHTPGEERSIWRLLAPHPTDPQALLVAQVTSPVSAGLDPLWRLLGSGKPASAGEPSWAYHYFGYLNTRDMSHLAWLRARGRDGDAAGDAEAVAKVFRRR